MQPVPDPSEPTIHPDQAADNTRRSADLLRAMIECGHEIALLIHQEAVATAARNAAEPNLPRLGRYTRVADFAGPYEKIFRGVRRGMLLLEKLAEPKPTGLDIALAEQRRAAQKKPAAPPEKPIHQLTDAELHERMIRMDRLDRIEALGLDETATLPNRTIDEILADICAQRGIASIDEIIPDEPGAVTDFLIRTGRVPPFDTPTRKPRDDTPPDIDYPLRR